jgi:plasmid stabilization system protein ParE
VRRAVSVSPAAEDDIERLIAFLSGDHQAMLAVADLLWSAAASLREFAERGAPGRRPGFRELYVPFRRSAYVIQYAVEDAEVVIVRIFHSLEDRPLA